MSSNGHESTKSIGNTEHGRVFQSFRKTDLSNFTINIVLAARSKDDPADRLRLLPIDVQHVGSEFRLLATRLLERQDYHSEQVELLELGYRPTLDRHQVEFVKYRADSILAPRVTALTEQLCSLSTIDSLRKDEDEFLEDLRFYALIATPPGNNPQDSIIFLRRFGKSKEITKSKKIFVFWKEQVYDTVKDKAFLFDLELDCALYKDFCFIFRKSDFASIFGYYQAIKDEVPRYVAEILQVLPMHNADKLEEACQKHEQKALKLRNAIQHGAFKRFSPQSISGTVRKHGLTINITGEKIDVEKSDVWQVINLLNDDYLTSETSGLAWVSSNKSKSEST